MADNFLERQYEAWLAKKAQRAKQSLKKKPKTKFWTRPGKKEDPGEPKTME